MESRLGTLAFRVFYMTDGSRAHSLRVLEDGLCVSQHYFSEQC